MEQEIWKQIVGYEGYYEISTMGNVRSLIRMADCGLGLRRFGGKMLKPCICKTKKYSYVSLSKKNKVKAYSVHRLVLITFLGSPRADCEACHINGNHNDNRLSNLRWDTHANNLGDMIIHGTRCKGTLSPFAKLNEEAVKEIRNSTESRKTLALRHGVSEYTIHDVLRGKSWRHVNLENIKPKRKYHRKVDAELVADNLARNSPCNKIRRLYECNSGGLSN